MKRIAETLEYACASVPGQVRAHNEDSLLSCPELGLWVIADGMGGHQRGEVASAMAVDSLRHSIAQQLPLTDAVRVANQAIIQAAQQDPDSQGMGTTLVALRLSGSAYELAWVGDSRAYLLSATGIQALSRDHSWVQAMIDAGQLSASEARSHPRKNVITQCLGQASLELEVGHVQGELSAGQFILLCSDGLHGELTDQRILQLCTRAKSAEAAVDALVDAANAAGGKDNISCVLVMPACPLKVELPPLAVAPAGLVRRVGQLLKNRFSSQDK